MTKQKTILTNRNGAILVGLIITMVIIAIAGTVTLHLTTGSTFTELFKNNNLKAYYLAEGGGRHAMRRIQADFDNNSKSCDNGTEDVYDYYCDIDGRTFTLSGGEFALAVIEDDPAYLVLETVGTVNPGSWVESKRNIVYKIAKPISFPFNDQEAFEKGWNVLVAKSADISSPGPSDGPALQIQTHDSGADAQTALITYKWNGAGGVANDGQPNFLTLWNEAGGLLSYNLQIKTKIDQEGSKGIYFMVGLSFRLDTKGTTGTVDDDSYGVSFFRGGPGNQDKAPWLDKLDDSFAALLETDKMYVVLWKKRQIDDADVYTVINYRQLTAGDGVITSSGEEDKLKSWSTLVLKVEERFISGIEGMRENHISVYLMNQGIYPKGTINWKVYSNPVSWNSGTQPIIDSTFTSENFNVRLPVEIGIHTLYDSNTQNDQFFSDFSMQVGSAGTGNGGVLQYY